MIQGTAIWPADFADKLLQLQFLTDASQAKTLPAPVSR